MKVEDKNFVIEKIEKYVLEDLIPSRRRIEIPIENWSYFETTMDEKVDDAFLLDRSDAVWEDFKLWDTWGGYDKVAWFRTTVKVPKDIQGKQLAFRFLVGPRDGGESTAEALLYLNGKPVQGIDIWHEEVILDDELRQLEEFEVAIKAWSGVLAVPKFRTFKVADLVVLDKTVDEFCFTVQTLVECVKEMDKDDLRRINLTKLLNKTFKKVDFLNYLEDDYYESIKTALAFIKKELETLYEIDEIKPTVYGVGHSHIDMAWLWRLNATREKASRTFSTVLNLMKQYPEYKFMHSSPQLYEFLKEDYPEIFEQVKQRIDEGQWEITGGMWIEPDTNVPSGEALVRQFVYGKRYIKDEFGKDTNLVWLPDVFGYSAALPQIMKKSGMKYFMTTKISWNQYNQFPYDTFMWKGIDGTEIFTHFITTPEDGSWYYTYNGHMSPEDVVGVWKNYKDKEQNSDLLIAYGWGDGGGGPTREMLEQSRVMKNLPGIPKVEMSGAEEYFEKIYNETEHSELGSWKGELYFEYHRGTYTSQADNKKLNRKTENLLHDLEFFATEAAARDKEFGYPKLDLDIMWKRTLLNQFHDILPGSSIRQVYEDTAIDYANIKEMGEGHLHNALDVLNNEIKVSENSIAIFNTTGIWRDENILIPFSEKVNSKTSFTDGVETLATQIEENGILVSVQGIPPYGYITLQISQLDESEIQEESLISVDESHIETPFYTIDLNDNGEINYLFDKENSRTVSVDKPMNQFVAYEDKPQRFDAWDLDVYYKEKPYAAFQLTNRKVIMTGNLKAIIEQEWTFNKSTITQQMILYTDSPRIDFETTIDWKEKQVFLKTYFPVNVHSEEATYEIQYGNIKRPTHSNNEYDFAMFEVPGHRWADLSEGDYGVAVLNDSKYGWDIHGDTIGLSLLKSAVRPDETQDRKIHNFTYSLFPHAKDVYHASVQEEAIKLNMPVISREVAATAGSEEYSTYSFVSTDADNVLIDTVKMAEDGDGIIVRIYEYKNSEGPVNLKFSKHLSKAVETNLCEEDEQSVDFEDNEIIFTISNFEVKTFKVFLSEE